MHNIVILIIAMALAIVVGAAFGQWLGWWGIPPSVAFGWLVGGIAGELMD